MNAILDLPIQSVAVEPAIHVERLASRSRRLRLSVVTETWPPELNGVAITLNRLVIALLDRGHEIELIRPKQPGGEASVGSTQDRPRLSYHEMLLRSLPIPRYPGLRIGLPCKGALIGHWSLHRPDLVHIATEGPLGWSALRAATQLRIPVTSDFRTNFHRYSSHYGLGVFRKPIMAYLRKFHNRAAKTFVPTQRLGQELGASGFRHLEVIGRGVDTTLFAPVHRDEHLRLSWGVTPEQVLVAYVGRLAAEKNLDLLMRSFDAIRQRCSDARLLIVGDGPMRASLQQRCPEAIFAGSRRGNDLAAHYASADMFLFPSLTDTFGNVVTEAMASGLPVLAFDCAAAHEHIAHGVSGLLVPEGQEGRFIDHAVRLAASGSLRVRLSKEARSAAERLSWEAIAQRFEAELVQVLQDWIQG